MNIATQTTSSYTEQRAGKGPSASLPLLRLVAVELRKLTDTRGGMLLLALIVLGGMGVMAIRAFAFDPDLQGTVATSGTILSVFLPVLGILAVTSEWSKRTALVTFALEPRRWRVMIAKATSVVMIAFVIGAVMIAVAYAFVAIASSVNQQPAQVAVSASMLLGWAFSNVIAVLSGVAIGALLLNAAAAIVTFFVGSVLWNLLAFTGEIGANLSKWLDLNASTGPLAAGEMTSASWAPLATSFAAWVGLPFVIGVVRVTRTELR